MIITLIFRNFATHICNKMANLLRLGIKNISIYFVLHSTFRNFATHICNITDIIH